MNNLKNELLNLGYRYFVYANCQYFDDGREITHYNLHFDSEYIFPPRMAIWLDSKCGEGILEDFFNGIAVILLLQNITLIVNEKGRLCDIEEYELLTIKPL
jgi:hypothetical protein